MSARVLFALSQYSGLAESFASGVWRPRGVPAICRMLEEAARRDTRSVACFLAGSSVGSTSRRGVVDLDGLTMTTMLVGRMPLRWLGRRIGEQVGRLLQAITVLRLIRRFKPDVIYVDRGNLLVAGLAARLTKRPVVYRFMGVSPHFRALRTGRKPIHILDRMLMRSPFSAVISTQDGTDAEHWIGPLLEENVPLHSWLNGVDEISAEDGRRAPDDILDVIFVGRLEPMKGGMTFVEAMLEAAEKKQEAIRATIVGDGSEMTRLKQRVAAAGAVGRVAFRGSLPHAEALQAYALADVYVSINEMGNLSNATLEAIAAGCAIILPQSRPERPCDTTTDRLIPPDAAVRYGPIDDHTALARSLEVLARDPGRVEALRLGSRRVASGLLETWPTRIAREWRLLDDLATSRRPA